MGICLYAIVELDEGHEAVDRGYDRWQILSEWSFNKDYDLQRWVRDNAIEGWPEGEARTNSDEECRAQEGRRWCDLQTLKLAVIAPDVLTARPLSLLRSIEGLEERGRSGRVLWYTV